MKTLTLANEEAVAKYKHVGRDVPNGIECPTCGRELVDCDSTYMLSFPPKTMVKCVVCSFRSTRII